MTPIAKRNTITAAAVVSMLAMGAVAWIAWPRAEPPPQSSHLSFLAPAPMPAMSFPATDAPPRGGEMAVVAERLAARLKDRDGNDGQGWALLGRSYVVLGRSQEALAAFERARSLLGESDAQLAADYASAQVAVNGGRRP